MSNPIVYDVLIRSEVEAKSELDAVRKIAGDIVETGFVSAGIHCAFEVIRDDSLSTLGKDNFSREVNGFAVFTSTQRQVLLTSIARALEAAQSGDSAPGKQLLSALSKNFDYLSNRGLAGVALPL